MKTWLIVIFFSVLAIILSSILPRLKISPINKELMSLIDEPSREDTTSDSSRYEIRTQANIPFRGESYRLNHSRNQAEDDIKNLATRAKDDIRTFYSDIGTHRHNLLSLETGM